MRYPQVKNLRTLDALRDHLDALGVSLPIDDEVAPDGPLSTPVDIPGIGMDSRAAYGNVLFSTGPNTEFGGDNDTACHLDLPMRNCSLWLDDELIVDRGQVMPADMRV